MRTLSPLAAVLLSLLTPRSCAQALPEPIAPLPGSVVLAGGGELSVPVMQAIARLAGGGARRAVLVGDAKSRFDRKRFEASFASVEVLRIASKAQLTSRKTLAPLLRAHAVWVQADMKALTGDGIFEGLLRAVLERGGVVGGAGVGARALAKFAHGPKKAARRGFDVLPRSVVFVGYHHQDDEAKLLAQLEHNPGSVGWGIPEASALVVHRGRHVSVVGKHPVTAIVAPRGVWKGRTQQLEPTRLLQRWDSLPKRIDFLAWTRSARLRCGPLFPPTKAPVPRVAKGTLIMSGGKGVAPEVFERFIELAGGKDATFVCIPSGADLEETQKDSYSQQKLEGLGCSRVHTLHTLIRSKAADPELLEPLRRANGVWIDGGRTFRLMDTFQGGQVHELMRKVLARGGVIGGSSAGAQVQGDFLMRGNPKSNKDLWWEGYETGFAFVRGVIVDAHFRQRGRTKTFPELMKRFPQMLGIGIDEKTAIVVSGSTAEVLGKNAITFYDWRQGPNDGVMLRMGQKYDLEARKPLDS